MINQERILPLAFDYYDLINQTPGPQWQKTNSKVCMYACMHVYSTQHLKCFFFWFYATHCETHCNTQCTTHTATQIATKAASDRAACHCGWCNTMQHIATHCNTLRHTVTKYNTWQHTATHCNTLQHTATCCNTHLFKQPYDRRTCFVETLCSLLRINL